MTLGHPLVDAAIADLRLTRTDLRAFRVLWSQLDFQEFREKKVAVLAVEIETEHSYAALSLRRLVDFGYLEEGDRSGKNVGTYRLPRAMPQFGVKSPISVAPRRIRRQLRDSL